MKTPPFLLIGCPVIILVACFVYGLTYPALHRTAFHAALIDAEKPAAETDSDNEDPTARQLRIQRAFAELGLSDAQKQQIGQIRQSILDRQQRREAIMNVLTPEQRAQWQEIRNLHRPDSNAMPPAPAASGSP